MFCNYPIFYCCLSDVSSEWETTLRPDIVKTITKLFIFILILFLDFGFFCSGRNAEQREQIFVNNIGDCARLCFVLFFICHLSLKEDYTSLLVDLGLVTWLAWNNEIWAEASVASHNGSLVLYLPCEMNSAISISLDLVARMT